MRCYLCSVIYGIFGALDVIWIWSIDFWFNIIVGISVCIIIPITFVINIIYFIRIKSILQIIKIIFCEIIFSVVSLVIFGHLLLMIMAFV